MKEYILTAIIIYLITIAVIYILYKRKKKKLIEELKYKATFDEQEYIQEIDKKKKAAQESYDKYCKEIAEKRKLQEELLNEDKNHVNEKIRLYEELEKERSRQRIEKEYRELKEKEFDLYQQYSKMLEEDKQKLKDNFDQEIEQQNNQKKDIYEQIDKVTKELEELQDKRNIVIEAWKREEEIREQQEFYKVKLTEDDIADIDILNSIRNKLNTKDALNRLIYDVFIKDAVNQLMLRIIGTKGYSGIYKITHIPSQKCYIGKSVDVKKRLIEHCKGAFGIATIADQKIHQAMNEYGINNFTFEILEKVPKEKLSEQEKYWIKYYNSIEYGWNEKIG